MSSHGPMAQVAERASIRFAHLMAEYGLLPQKIRCWDREAMVPFASDSVLLTVHLEAGCDPYVSLGARDGERFGLNHVVSDRAADREGELVTGPGETEADLIERLAELTRLLATDVLAGDFSSFPRLRRVRARMTREENIREWGTSTGETPRFDRRPTLEELFAGADDDGLIEARVYQGIWDYGYDKGELATYLGSTEQDVQMHLDRWDGLLVRS